MTTLNKLGAAGVIKRSDTGVRVRLRDIRIADGFNERAPGPALEDHIEALKRHKLAGGKWPNIEVKLEEAGVVLVDGHCRTEALRRAIAEDTSIADENGDVWVRFDVFDGNDAEAVAQIALTNSGLKLAPMELANVYRRLAAFDWPVSRIATKMQKSEAHVRQLLDLARADTAVQRMVAAGTVSASVAVKAVRKHGAKAGADLAARREAGGGKVREVTDKQLLDALETAHAEGVLTPAPDTTLRALAQQFLDCRRTKENGSANSRAGA